MRTRPQELTLRMASDQLIGRHLGQWCWWHGWGSLSGYGDAACGADTRRQTGGSSRVGKGAGCCLSSSLMWVVQDDVRSSDRLEDIMVKISHGAIGNVPITASMLKRCIYGRHTVTHDYSVVFSIPQARRLDYALQPCFQSWPSPSTLSPICSSQTCELVLAPLTTQNGDDTTPLVCNICWNQYFTLPPQSD